MTHNLKLCIVDNNQDIIENSELLESIYNDFCDKLIQKNVSFLEKEINMIVYWERLKTPLTILQKYFIGECFTNPILSDAALYEITRLLLLDTEEKLKLQYNLSINWHIEFYISKCLDDNIPNK